MRFPKRSSTHFTEAEANKKLMQLAPKNWVVREVTERDYGIDYYVEIFSKNNELTGDLCSIQLKGTQGLNWGDEKAKFSGIKTSTANYWLGLPVPVFLLVADLSEDDIYYVSVKTHLKKQFIKLSNQDTVSLPLNKKLNLKSIEGKAYLHALYHREKNTNKFEFYLSMLLSNIDKFSEMTVNRGRDHFLEVEIDVHLDTRNLYMSCLFVANYLNIDWKVSSLNDIYHYDYSVFNDQDCKFHEQSYDRLMGEIEEVLQETIAAALKFVLITQKEYWSSTHPVFYQLCSNYRYQFKI